MATTLVVADACVLINLSATQMLPAIVEAAEVRLGVVQPEVWDEVSGGFGAGASREKVVVDLLQHQSDGLVEPFIMTADELVGFVALAGDNLDDGEAASLSVAISRNLDIASDDRAVGRVIGSRGLGVVQRRTSDLLLMWLRGGAAEADVAAALDRIEIDGSFLPPRADPNRAWWLELRRRHP